MCQAILFDGPSILFPSMLRCMSGSSIAFNLPEDNNPQVCRIFSLVLLQDGNIYSAELYKMVCDRNETDLNIKIPAVMLPQDAGASLESSLKHGFSGNFPV